MALQVELLPIQVRQVKDKMHIIERVVGEQPSVLRQSEQVLLLGQKLGMAAPADQQALREMLARAMLGGKYSVGGEGVLLSEGAAEVRELMMVGRASVWDLAWELAQTAAVAVAERERLAAYALAHCPASELERVRRGWTALRAEQRLGPQVYAAAAAGRWDALALWTGVGATALVEEGGPWAGPPRAAVMAHPFHSSEVPGAKSSVGILVDPYIHRRGYDGNEEEVGSWP